jgi:signal transduction histidine kinase
MPTSILIIDDEQLTTHRLVKLLGDEGFAASGVTTGAEGLEHLKREAVDVVITDMRMAGMDGLQVLKAVKEINPSTEVIMVSGYPTVEVAVETMKQGAYDYLQKPINPDELLLLVRRCMERKALARELDVERRLRKDLEEANQQLRLAQEQLIQSEKLATIGEMAAGVAHEINNPLTAVTMNIAFLSGSLDKLVQEGTLNGPIEEKVRKNLAIIESEVDRTAKIVHSLLKFSRKSAAESREPAQMNDILERTLEPIAHQLELINIRITRRFADGLPPVSVNINQLQQVFLNLINNARDALKECEGPREITITTLKKPAESPEGGWVSVAIQDTAKGIPPEILKKIWNPFFTTKESGKGTGLGLSISQHIVADHGGRISVESVPGQGTTFTVDFPL